MHFLKKRSSLIPSKTSIKQKPCSMQVTLSLDLTQILTKFRLTQFLHQEQVLLYVRLGIKLIPQCLDQDTMLWNSFLNQMVSQSQEFHDFHLQTLLEERMGIRIKHKLEKFELKILSRRKLRIHRGSFHQNSNRLTNFELWFRHKSNRNYTYRLWERRKRRKMRKG